MLFEIDENFQVSFHLRDLYELFALEFEVDHFILILEPDNGREQAVIEVEAATFFEGRVVLVNRELARRDDVGTNIAKHGIRDATYVPTSRSMESGMPFTWMILKSWSYTG